MFDIFTFLFAQRSSALLAWTGIIVIIIIMMIVVIVIIIIMLLHYYIVVIVVIIIIILFPIISSLSSSSSSSSSASQPTNIGAVSRVTLVRTLYIEEQGFAELCSVLFC